MKQMHRSRRRQRGNTLVESLVAVVVLSFGALGYAGLQIKGLTSNANALARSKATQLVSDMADRVRSNPSAIDTYKTFTAAVAKPGCGGATACSPDDMARYDFATWLETVTQELPGGAGEVCGDSTPVESGSPKWACDNAPGSLLAVKVKWTDHGEERIVWTLLRP